jgi:hypothetical protein
MLDGMERYQLAEDEQWAKLRMVVAIADEVWEWTRLLRHQRARVER